MDRIDNISTGMKGFDKAIDMLKLGDNVVWQINHIQEYKKVVKYYIDQLKLNNRKIVYINFGNENLVIDELNKIKVYDLNPSIGFEKFTTTIHNIISEEGIETFYVFGNLTELQKSWYSELMTMNFFKVIFPHLNKFRCIAYFAIERNEHTYDTISELRKTTQLLLDIYEVENTLYIYPRKVLNRYSQTMFFPHKIIQDNATPITSSLDTTELVSKFKWNSRRLAYWRRTLNKAKNSLSKESSEQEEMKRLLINILVGKDLKINEMCMKYFNLSDLIEIAYREIGTGFIGGKSIGMLLATSILRKSEEYKEEFNELLEPHDSFFIGADIFYSYIVENGMWDLRIKQKTEEGYFKYSSELKYKLESGRFSDMIKEQFMHMLEYYGQSPIVVRSSSLLEDSFGNAFAGKYESVFCVNQGTPEERLEAFEKAVRTVYASTMNQDALNYRKNRGLDKKDEQMGILVQRVSGDYYGQYFFPHIAGVGNSSNLYVWNKKIDMNAGMLRLVFGLGTRAVDRVHSDYARIITLDDPMRLPLINFEDEQKFSQHDVDVLDFKNNKLTTVPINEAIKNDIKADINIFGRKDYKTQQILREMRKDPSTAPFLLNFQQLLKYSKFPEVMKKVLQVLSKEYRYPVDIEFTANFNKLNEFTFNIVQCRPLQTRGLGKTVKVPKLLDKNSCIFSSVGNFMGGNIRLPIEYIVFVDSKEYINLSHEGKYNIARQIGIINQKFKNKNVMLMGPGRWGTSTPALGVPVHFTELCNMSVMCEIAYSNEGLMPELSYGSHFFQDLVETGIFYVALFDNNKDIVFNEEKLKSYKNIAKEIIRDTNINTDVIKIYKTKDLEIYSDITTQIVTCAYDTSL